VLSDGLRRYGDKLLMIEGEGRLDLVTVDGDRARIDVVQDGYKGPVWVTKVGTPICLTRKPASQIHSRQGRFHHRPNIRVARN
jgi:hypothetical protein